jgi:uncharacterized membrane protein YkvA (DUF1232 family)
MKKLFFIVWRISRSDLRLAWFALKHPQRPVWLMPALGLLALYAVAPFNLVVLPLGLLDDFVLVPMLLHFLLKLLPKEILYAQLRPVPIRR